VTQNLKEEKLITQIIAAQLPVFERGERQFNLVQYRKGMFINV
jgi:hypothetical protein